MKNEIRFLLPVFVALFYLSGPSMAQDTMYVHQHNGKVLKIDISQIDSIVFYPSPGTADSVFEVKYQIDPVSNYFTKITYNDEDEQEVSLDDISGFPDGVKILNVSKRPFTARLSVEVYNPDNTPLNFSLIIYLDGVVKAFTQGSAPANTENYVASAEYQVQINK